MASVKELKDQLDKLYKLRMKLERRLGRTVSSIDKDDRFGDVDSKMEASRIKKEIEENLSTEQEVRKKLFGSWAPKSGGEIVHREEE